MDTQSQPPPGYTVTLTSPNMLIPQPEKKLTPPMATRFSPQRPQKLQLPLSSSRTLSSQSLDDGATRFSPHRPPQPHLPLSSEKKARSFSPSTVRNGSPLPQFSTPPPPPMFSSPLQPVAAPFRKSPATPQPAAFSSGSAFPTSSPLVCTNGSSELPVQKSSAVDESSFESPYVLFSAHKVLKSKKLANVASLGFGALVSPGREIAPSPQVVQRGPHRCQNCRSYANLYCEILLGTGQWQCVFCKKLNDSNGDYVASSKVDLHHLAELSSSEIDYIHAGSRQPGYIPLSEKRISAPIFLVIDECLDEANLHCLQGSLHALVDSLPPTSRIGIMSYGRTISVYDFSEGSMASADVLPGGKSPTQESLNALIYGTGIYLSPIHASLPVAHSIFSSLRPYRQEFPEVSRDRCLGAAVEVALAIIRGSSEKKYREKIIRKPGGNQRILVCSGGPNTYGPGSVPHSVSHPNYSYIEKTAMKWMEHLGQQAYRQGIIVDILCAGAFPVRVPALQPLVRTSAGVLVLHDDFGEAFGVNLKRAATRAAGSHGLFEILCSDDIHITQVIGPGEEAPADANEPPFKNDSSFRIQMYSVEETQSFALSFETKGNIKNDHVYFQFVVRYLDAYQVDISRVITVRLPTVDSVSSYLGSIQKDVAAVLITKRTLLHARTSSDAISMRLTVDERLKDIASRFGSQVPKSELYQFPKELSSLPEMLFHLRRGPLLGSIIGHEDERFVLRNLYLNASFDLSLRMLAPRCLMHREGDTFKELPAYDIVMQSNAAVVLDHGTDVFIWLGAELAAQEGKSASALTACRTLAEELTEYRFPAPRILAFKEGSSRARYFISRLIPAHKDPPYEQEARFPQLRSLSEEQRTKLKSSFLHFDDYSFCEWMLSLKLVPPEPS